MQLMFVSQPQASIIFILCLFYSTQSAAALTYLADNRYSYYRADSSGYLFTQNYYPSTPFADFTLGDNNVQESSLGASGFTAYGSGARSHENDVVYQSYTDWTYFDISFNLDTGSIFDLTGQLQGANDTDSYFFPGLPDTGIGNVSITLYSGTALDAGNILFTESLEILGGYESLLLNFSDFLATGDYRIRAVSEPDVVNLTPNGPDYTFVWSQFDISASVTAVPLPAAVWLFVSGLLGLVGVARQKKAA
ncbi:MAG: VPLPA-CTERM sorting domain-containing protein [Candidatus Thiodiazotropha endolucinida]|nr:VPLPA-CTERM sorting domain-containing protein [Candidatus Thiodiazotropha endolucinida]